MKHKIFNIHIFIYSYVLIYLTSFTNCSFQADLFRTMNLDYKGKNLIISPLSIFQILSLTSNGSSDQTLFEFIKVLKSENLNSLNSLNSFILSKSSKYSSLSIANAILSRFTPLPGFIQSSKNYHSEIFPLESADQINRWCSKKTRGKIPKVIDSLDSSALMVLLNAVYFKGKWEKKFSPRNTKLEPFYNLGIPKYKKNIKTMTLLAKFHYYENSDLKIIELPYEKDSLSAIILLPSEGKNINDFISQLSQEKIQDYISSMLFRKVSLYLPKFELNFFDYLNNVLQKMGIKDAFDENQANFVKIRKENDLFVKDVVHKTYIKIEEDGTEAAGVTKVVSHLRMACRRKRFIEEKIYEMRVNRPFLFFIKGQELPENMNMIFMSKIEKIDKN